jgi:thiamine biosynthesis protein ThiI
MTLTYDRILLARIGEISLKGLNRGDFEARLVSNLLRRLKGLGEIAAIRAQSVVRLEPSDADHFDFEEAIRRMIYVFGLVSVSPARSFRGGIEEMRFHAVEHFAPLLADGKKLTFKIEARRSDKRFPLDSPAICREVGACLLETYPEQLTVDVHHPDIALRVEVRDTILLFDRIVKGHRGLPVGTAGKAMLLLSGGIDSPVAGYMMASRGLELECVHFQSIPFTSERALQKVVDLATKLSLYAGRLRLHIVPFAGVQTMLRDGAPEDMLTLLMRRAMMRIAERIARENRCQAIVTGESLGQVASQTLESIAVTDVVVGMPVFRPLVGIDKDATIEIARRIDTFETSIEPYEDCCTIFVSKHPKTKPSLPYVERLEARMPFEEALEEAIRGIEIRMVGG